VSLLQVEGGMSPGLCLWLWRIHCMSSNEFQFHGCVVSRSSVYDIICS